jgi:hypothetical protein
MISKSRVRAEKGTESRVGRLEVLSPDERQASSQSDKDLERNHQPQSLGSTEADYEKFEI